MKVYTYPMTSQIKVTPRLLETYRTLVDCDASADNSSLLEKVKRSLNHESNVRC
jgi:hypothetical protein